MSKRGDDWREFAEKVADHVENYTVPQYGGKGEDQVTEWTLEDCALTIKRYVARIGKNARQGEQERDFLKIAHYAQLAALKFAERGGEHA